MDPGAESIKPRSDTHDCLALESSSVPLLESSSVPLLDVNCPICLEHPRA